MKKSEELRLKAAQKENDLKAMGIITKAFREERAENIGRYIQDLRDRGFTVDEDTNLCRFIIQPTHFGIIDYYPKANKALVRTTNRWISGGLGWIRRNFINPINPT